MGGLVEYSRLNGYLAVSRAIGDFDRQINRKTLGLTAKPDIITRRLRGDDEFVIMACDGLWDVIESQDAVVLVRDLLVKNKPIDLVCEALMDLALRRECDDNITVMIVAFPWWDEATQQWHFLSDQTNMPPSSRMRPRLCTNAMHRIGDLLN